MTRRGFLLGATSLACARSSGAAVIQPPYNPQAPVILSMPGGLGWDSTTWPITVQLYDVPGNARATGAVNLTAEGLFNAVSTALTAPGVTYYVNATSGSDSNAGTSSGAAFQSINKAITAANAAAAPALVYVQAQTYIRAYGPGGLSPTHDIAFVAVGGRVNVGTFDAFTAAADGTYTNCYSLTSITGNVDRVCDMANLNQWGNYTTLANAPSAAACNATPGSWFLISGTKVLVNRLDGAAVTSLNTRIYRSAVNFLVFNSQVNVYMGDGLQTAPNTFPPSGFDFEGTSANEGCFYYYLSSPTATRNVITAKNCSFKYAGGVVSTAAVCVGMNSHNGLAAFFNCRADESATDGFNHHNSNSAGETLYLTVNCSAYNNGGPNSSSDNGWTSHETCIGIDVAGHYAGNHGGTCRSINSARGWLCGTFVENDKGDVVFGGINAPDAFSVQGTAQYWCDRTKVNMPGGNSIEYNAEQAGATIYLRNVWPIASTRGGPGTIAAY